MVGIKNIQENYLNCSKIEMKITIIEDNVYDVVDRYAYLTKTQHEVHVVLDEEGLLRTGMREDRCNSVLCEKGGFNPENIHYGIDEILPADIYFCDGLRGYCFKVVDKLGKDIVYINSDDCEINKRAKERGYNLGGWKGSLEEIMDEKI